MDLFSAIVFVAVVGAVCLVLFGIPTLLIGSAIDKARSDAYYRPRIEAEREAKERRQMDEFLDTREVTKDWRINH
jgi:hypothetical protein